MTLIAGECEKCGATGKLTIHHKVPKSEGGNLMPENVMVLCRKCHREEHHIIQKRFGRRKNFNLINNEPEGILLKVVRYEKGKEPKEFWRRI